MCMSRALRGCLLSGPPARTPQTGHTLAFNFSVSCSVAIMVVVSWVSTRQLIQENKIIFLAKNRHGRALAPKQVPVTSPRSETAMKRGAANDSCNGSVVLPQIRERLDSPFHDLR